MLTPHLPEGVSVVADSSINFLLAQEKHKNCDIFVNGIQLGLQLIELGEDLTTTAESPIVINIFGYRRATNMSLAAAWRHTNDAGVTERHVGLPLISVSQSKAPGIGTFEYDPNEINRSLIHELKHVADFRNPDVIREHDAVISKYQRLARRAKILPTATGLMLNGLGLAFGIDSDHKRNVLGGAIAAGAMVTGSVIQLVNSHRVDDKYFFRAYHESPLEIRAQQVSDVYRSQKPPTIVGIRRAQTNPNSVN